MNKNVTDEQAANEPTGPGFPGREQGHGVLGVLFGRGRAVSETVYGTVIVMSAIVAASAETQGRDLVAIVVSTVVVIWITHVYANGLGESIAGEQRLNWPELRAIAGRQAAILGAALLPTLALSLAALHVMHQQRAIWLALAIGWITLLIEGVRYARIEHMGKLGTLLPITVNLALGAIVVSMKVVID